MKYKLIFLLLTHGLEIIVDVGTRFKFVRDLLWLFVPLEPHHQLGMEPPGHPLQGLCSEILGFCPFEVIKNEE